MREHDRRWRLAGALLIAAAVTGCADRKVKVESSTSWNGTVEGRSVSGSNNQEIDVDESGEVCASITKLTWNGTLTVRVVTYSDWGLFSTSDENESDSTVSPYGRVTVCNTRN